MYNFILKYFNRRISEINFLTLEYKKKSQKFDYYDLIKPVAVLFGENKNYIIYYQINKKSSIYSFEEISIEEDLLSQLQVVKKYNLQEVSLVEGLMKCVMKKTKMDCTIIVKKRWSECFQS